MPAKFPSSNPASGLPAKSRCTASRGARMNVIVCEEPGVLALRERVKPTRLAGEVLIRIRRVGMCGTDYHIFGGTQPYLTYPRVIGHELSGEVVEADAQSPFQRGQPV